MLDQVEFEFKTIALLSYEAYFLTVEEIVRFV